MPSRVAVFKLRKVDCSGSIHAQMGVRVRRCDMAAARLESNRGVRGGVKWFRWAVPVPVGGAHPTAAENAQQLVVYKREKP